MNDINRFDSDLLSKKMMKKNYHKYYFRKDVPNVKTEINL